MNENIWEKELWTQNEVAEYFRVVPGTVINWRKQGLISFWKAPGPRKVLYHRDEIKDFCEKHTSAKKGGGEKPKPEISRGKPCVSSTRKDWRI
jgi:hypothetical protein